MSLILCQQRSVGIASVEVQGEPGPLMLSGHNKDEERIKTQKVDDGINVILFLMILLLTFLKI